MEHCTDSFIRIRMKNEENTSMVDSMDPARGRSSDVYVLCVCAVVILGSAFGWTRVTLRDLCGNTGPSFLPCAPTSATGCGAQTWKLRQLHVTGRIQKTVLYLKIRFFLILHRATRKTITFKMVLAGLKSVNEKYPNSNLKSAHPTPSTALNWRR